MMRASTLAAAALILSLPAPVWAARREPLPEPLTGKVVLIGDGDTITVLVDKTQHEVRLAAVDGPERQRMMQKAFSPHCRFALAKDGLVATQVVKCPNRCGLFRMPSPAPLPIRIPLPCAGDRIEGRLRIISPVRPVRELLTAS